MADQTEAETVETIATRAQQTQDLGNHVVGTVGPTGELHLEDLEEYQLVPNAKTGEATLRTVDGFDAYVGAHKTAHTEIFADVTSGRIVAVLDGFAPSSDPSGDSRPDGAGWGRHKAGLKLTHSREWLYWVGQDGKWQTQVDFAAFIEEGLPDIVRPSGADMLELATSFQANTAIEFKSAQRRDNGEVQLTYNEAINATAGRTGTMEIPEEIVVGLRVYEGLDVQEIVAKLRYRIASGNLALRLQFLRTGEVRDEAVRDITAKIETDTGITPYEGLPR